MSDTQESRGFPVNSDGEIVAEAASGNDVIVGVLASGLIPINPATGKMPIVLPDTIPLAFVTEAQRLALTPDEGDEVYQTDGVEGKYVYEASAWTNDQVLPTAYVYVGKNGSDTTGNGGATKPYLTVQHAIDVSSAGTTVFVWPGTYAENITFKAGVNIAATAKYSVTITGNHVCSFSGTVMVYNIILASASGITLQTSGSNAYNLQLTGSHVNSVNGDAINWAGTNASGKIQLLDGNISVATSGASARAFYSTTGAAGSVIFNRVSVAVNNPNNVCLSVGGSIAITHTSDSVVGQMVISGTSSIVSSLCTHITGNIPVMTTTSSGMSVFLDCIDTTTATPAITGSGGFSYSAVILGSSGAGSASTLNGGIGSIALQMAPFKLRAGTLKPVPQDGLMEYDGTHLYFTIGSTRSTII